MGVSALASDYRGDIEEQITRANPFSQQNNVDPQYEPETEPGATFNDQSPAMMEFPKHQYDQQPHVPKNPKFSR